MDYKFKTEPYAHQLHRSAGIHEHDPGGGRAEPDGHGQPDGQDVGG